MVVPPWTFEIKGYLLILGWFAWDLISAIRNVPGIASWAHVGGMVAGFICGIVLLRLQRVRLEDYDHPTVLDLLPSRES